MKHKHKSNKHSRTFIAVVTLILVFSVIYLIESELLSIKHSLQREFKRVDEDYQEYEANYGRILPQQKDLVRDESVARFPAEEVARFPANDELVPAASVVVEIPQREKSPVTPSVEQIPNVQEIIIEQENQMELTENLNENNEEVVTESWMNYDVQLNDFLKSSEPPNKGFIFHNKLPKSGSSTMNNVLKLLSNKHGYNFRKVEPTEVALHENEDLLKLLKKEKEEPYLLLKHHYFFDFTQFGEEQPTYINVIRDPLEWFTSRFYFSRYGWNRKPGCRDELCGMSEEEINMSIDECVAKRHPQCTDSSWLYFPFICGSDIFCLNTTSEEAKALAFEQSKKHVMNDYYLVGILEQFEETLMLFDRLLPDFYEEAVDIWKGEFVQHKQELTKTQHKQEMNEESRKFFLEGPLKYEKMFYDFTRKVFNERLKYWNIQLPPEDIEN